MTATVRTQADLDAAIAAGEPTIYIESDAGVWLTVTTTGSSHVVARGSSHVEAWGSSHVEAGKYVAVHLHSQRVDLDATGTVIDMTGLDLTDPATWCEVRGVKTETIDGHVIAWVYKAVDDDWTTNRGTSYAPGATPEAPDWKRTGDCGNGLHFGVTPSHSADYFFGATRYVKCGVRLDECEPLDDKVKARRVVVPCVEVNRWGAEVSNEAVAS